MTQQPIDNIGQELLQGIENGCIEQEKVIGCLENSNIYNRAIGYEVTTNPLLRKRIQRFVPDSIYPKLCLQYLLDCTALDIEPQPEDLVHSQAEAFFELAVPMDTYWKKHDAALGWNCYWGMISRNLTSIYPEYRDRLVTHFLESFPIDKPFKNKMGEWKETAILKRYVQELEKIVHISF